MVLRNRDNHRPASASQSFDPFPVNFVDNRAVPYIVLFPTDHGALVDKNKIIAVEKCHIRIMKHRNNSNSFIDKFFKSERIATWLLKSR